MLFPPSADSAPVVQLAERAAWDFVEKEKPQFDIATICPPLVLGPLIHQVAKASSLNTSVKQFYDVSTALGF